MGIHDELRIIIQAAGLRISAVAQLVGDYVIVEQLAQIYDYVSHMGEIKETISMSGTYTTSSYTCTIRKKKSAMYITMASVDQVRGWNNDPSRQKGARQSLPVEILSGATSVEECLAKVTRFEFMNGETAASIAGKFAGSILKTITTRPRPRPGGGGSYM